MAISSLQDPTLTKPVAPTSTKNSSEAGSEDRFLKLLVAQMQNQDPLNPMDNAQVTSQMAQINTVTGIDKLNNSIQGLSGQALQSQALQAAGLVGRDVIVPGNQLDITDGVGQGGFELAGAADKVKIEILSQTGQVTDTINLEAQSIGMHSFDWPAGTATNENKLKFRVTATQGNSNVTATALMRDTVNAVSTSGSTLNLELKNAGTVAYGTVKALN